MQSIQDDDFDHEECIEEFDLEECDPALSSASPIQEMAQSVAASLASITATAPSHAALRAEMNAANTSVQNRIRELMQSDPILSKFKNKSYGIQVKNFCLTYDQEIPVARKQLGIMAPYTSAGP